MGFMMKSSEVQGVPAALMLLPSSVCSTEGLKQQAPSRTEVLEAIGAQVAEILTFAGNGCGAMTFMAAEKALASRVFILARLFVVLFLFAREELLAATLAREIERDGRTFQRKPAQARNLNTTFGVVRYWRTYMRGSNNAGFHPLDAELGLTADRISFNLLAVSVRLATRLSFAEARSTLSWFTPTPPSTEVIEHGVLGMGAYAEKYFEIRPAPDGDGDVLVIMLDGKGAPTATQEELDRRRGKRKKKDKAPSPRHRGRMRRGRYPKKIRRKKGDKSKHAKMATMVVMYTLKRVGPNLLGPINVRRYASFGPKEHAFQVARREADKRGFTEGSGKPVQVLTDGDLDLSYYTKRYFPSATHTIDVVHIVEKLWDAGGCLYKEGSPALAAWMVRQKKRLYNGQAAAIVHELAAAIARTAKTGPGNKGKRARLTSVHGYLNTRLHQLDYDRLLALDLEISTGMIEGAIKNTVGKRCDHGGMRWIKERVEAVLQLRCIELDGDWDAFTQWLHDQSLEEAKARANRPRLQRLVPRPLPTLSDVKKAA